MAADQMDPGETASACQRALMTANAGTVHLPGSAEYARAMGSLFSTEASRTHPLCVVQPENASEVARALSVARDLACPLTVRGGSHSSLCAGDRAVMLDLSAHCAGVSFTGNEVTAGGGATMGAILETLAPQARLLPVGVARPHARPHPLGRDRGAVRRSAASVGQ
jgi:FAD/FMN-containing dehydrogenase